MLSSEQYIEKAKNYEREKDFDNAIECWAVALALKPIAEIAIKLGRAYYENENYDMAIKKFEEVTHLPGSEQDQIIAIAYKGTCYARKKLYKQAIEIFDILMKLYPNNQKAIFKSCDGKGFCYYYLAKMHNSGYDKNNVTMSGGLKIALAVVLLFASVMTMPSTKTDSVTPASSPQSINTEETATTSESEELAETQEEITKEEKQEEKPNLELLEGTETTTDEFSRYIEGKVKNNTDHEYSYVQITFNLYDDEGALVDTALANVNNLEAGGIWKFKAILLNDEATSYKLSELTGF